MDRKIGALSQVVGFAGFAAAAFMVSVVLGVVVVSAGLVVLGVALEWRAKRRPLEPGQVKRADGRVVPYPHPSMRGRNNAG